MYVFPHLLDEFSEVDASHLDGAQCLGCIEEVDFCFQKGI